MKISKDSFLKVDIFLGKFLVVVRSLYVKDTEIIEQFLLCDHWKLQKQLTWSNLFEALFWSIILYTHPSVRTESVPTLLEKKMNLLLR